MLAENLAWLEKNLETPTRFGRTKSKGFYRRKTRGIAWFKDTASEHLARMHQIKAVLERYGHFVVMLSEARVGYVIYDDAFAGAMSGGGAGVVSVGLGRPIVARVRDRFRRDRRTRHIGDLDRVDRPRRNEGLDWAAVTGMPCASVPSRSASMPLAT